MKLVKMFLYTALITAMPLAAHAGDLKIANNTKTALSFKINHVCSDKFDGFGIIPPATIKFVAEKDFNKECEYNATHCVAYVYTGNNCQGKNVAEVGFDISYGVNYISSSTSGLDINGNGFNLIFTSNKK